MIEMRLYLLNLVNPCTAGEVDLDARVIQIVIAKKFFSIIAIGS